MMFVLVGVILQEQILSVIGEQYCKEFTVNKDDGYYYKTCINTINVGVISGIVVGSIIGIAILITLIYFCACRYRRSPEEIVFYTTKDDVAILRNPSVVTSEEDQSYRNLSTLSLANIPVIKVNDTQEPTETMTTSVAEEEVDDSQFISGTSSDELRTSL